MVDPAVERFIRANLPAPPARVLEVGAGSGDLARVLADLGYDVTAIDPGGEGDVLPLPLLEIGEPAGSFDAAVAVVSLHHVEPLEPSCRRLAEVVRPGGTLVVDEIDVRRFDERAAGWLLEQWRAIGRDAGQEPRELVEGMRAHLHPLEAIAEALDPWFELGPIARSSYLYRWHLEPGLRPAEEALIAGGELPAVGARFVAPRRDSLR
jgi:SAM-dependent methyltransferase